jgi:dTDP-4-dehydrorhamnose reductase
MKILVLGASGMLGSAMFRILFVAENLQVIGSLRSSSYRKHFPASMQQSLYSGVDVKCMDDLAAFIANQRPNVIINCIGLVKQLSSSKDPLQAIAINSLLPHRLAYMCQLANARLIHFSTDCVFSGNKGSYIESDLSDAEDLYGKSKFLGEVSAPHAVTVRTSIIGHELESKNGLIDWFLSNSGSIKGFTKMIFSGLPTNELAGIVRDYILKDKSLHGVYHVSSKAISKYQLLAIVADVYGKEIQIAPDDEVVLDRSLVSTRFRELTGYSPPEWRDLVQSMYSYSQKSSASHV